MGSPIPFPSAAPTSAPTSSPTSAPTSSPTAIPTSTPTATPSSASCTKYVATTGSDSGTGTISSPYATINKAQSIAVAGDTICVKAGRYLASKSNITKSGIIIKKDPDTSGAAILDGTGASITYSQPVVFIGASNITFDGFEITNSPGEGIETSGSNITISNNIIHNVQSKAALIVGSNITFTTNEIYDASMKNINHFFGSGGWAAVVTTYYQSSTTPSTNVNFINNYVHDSWGEGISPDYLDGGLIKGNTVKDTFSVLVYLDRAKNITVDGNYLSVTRDTYNNINNFRADAIEVATEIHGSGPIVSSSNITVSNNLILGSHFGINYWHDSRNTNTSENTYTGLKFYYNVIKDTTSAPFYVSPVNSPYIPPSASEIKNNIVYKGGDGNTALINNSSVWTISNNDWPNGIPSVDSTTKGSFALDPLFVNPGSPVFGYKVQNSSPAIGRGVGVSTTNDFFGVSRPASNTTLGINQH